MGERTVVNLTDKSDTAVIEEVKERQLTRAERKARLVSVLDRGIVGDRLFVENLPSDKYGEWVSNDKMEIYRMESMGFEVDREYASKRSLHSDGTNGTSIVGDVVFMTCPREVKELIEEIKTENYNAANSPRGGRQKEERDFATQADSVGMPVEMKSRVDGANADAIRAAVTAKN